MSATAPFPPPVHSPRTTAQSSSAQALQADVRSLQRLLAQQKQQLIAQRSEDFGFEWTMLNDAIGLLHDPQQRNGWSYTAYIGFATKQEATAWLKRLQRQQTGTAPPASPAPRACYQLRKARRLPAHRWEIKATGVTLALLESLADERRHPRPVHSA